MKFFKWVYSIVVEHFSTITVKHVQDIQYQKYEWIDVKSDGAIITFAKTFRGKVVEVYTVYNSNPTYTHTMTFEDGTEVTDKFKDAWQRYRLAKWDADKLKEALDVNERIKAAINASN